MSKVEINDELLARYLTGDAEPEEAVAVTDWLAVAGNRTYFEKLETTWHATVGQARPRFSKAEAWKQVSAGIEVPAESVHPRKQSYWPLSIAAAVLLLALSAYFVWFRSDAPSTPEMGAVSTSDSFRFVELVDRSTVTLHRNSELLYPDKFIGRERRVRLSRGEAFFSVTTDAEHPFIVEAGDVQIRVVGTEFNVELQDSALNVHVREGSVLVSTGTESVSLMAGMTGRVSAGHISVSDGPVGNLYSYATQRLVFDEAPLAQVIRDLEDSYPNTFELKNPSLENCRLTANFYKDDIDKIVNLVAETLNLTVAKNGRHFTLEGEGCL